MALEAGLHLQLVISISWLLSQDANSQRLFQYRACMPGVVVPTMMVMNFNPQNHELQIKCFLL